MSERQGRARALIVEDEPIAGQHLRQLLETRCRCDVIGQCVDVGEAEAAVARNRPDFILLDISLRGSNGFDLLEKLPSEDRPPVIIVTAVADHAYRAFQCDAADYLLKPFTAERLENAVEKALFQRQYRASAASPRDFLVVKTEGHLAVLKFHEIHSVVALNHICAIHAGTDRHIVRETLAAIESQLPANSFLRVNRGAIINIDHVRAIHPKSHGDAVAEMRNGQAHTISRRYRPLLSHLYPAEKK